MATSSAFAESLSSTIDSLKKEIETLSIKRKDMKRFLDIDKEKKEIAKLKAQGIKIRESATKQALDIVSSAKKEAESIRNKALADAQIAHQKSETLMQESRKRATEARRRSDAAGKRISAAVKAEMDLNGKRDWMDTEKRKFKSHLATLARIADSIGG